MPFRHSNQRTRPLQYHTSGHSRTVPATNPKSESLPSSSSAPLPTSLSSDRPFSFSSPSSPTPPPIDADSDEPITDDDTYARPMERRLTLYDGGGGGSSRPIRAHPNTLREKAQLAQHTKSVRTRKLEHKLKWEKELDDAAQQSDGGGTPVAHSPRQPKSPRGKRK